jgi:hypothetical protein
VATAKLEDQYSKAKPGESASDKAARQKKYYTAQRESAQERGDQGTVDKIYGKLGKKAPNVDADRGNKAILAAAPALASGGAGLARLLGRRAAGAAGSALATGASKLASKAGSAVEKDVKGAASGTSRALSGARKAITGSERKALPAPKTKVPVENDSALSKIMKNQAGRKVRIADSKPAGQRRADNSVRSKAGPTNREAAGLKKSKKAS